MLRPNDTTMVADGTIKTGVTDLRDIGRYVALIINDERTINRMVFAFGEVLSQREIFKMMEEISGEKINAKIVLTSLSSDHTTMANVASIKITAEQIESDISDTKSKQMSEPDNAMYRMRLYSLEYMRSKFVRGDNTPESAKRLQYLNAADLYPDFAPLKFRNYLLEVVSGKGYRPYRGLSL